MSLKLYTYFRPKYVIFPTLYQNWTAVLKSAACVLETLSLFQTKICDFIYPTCISDLNVCPQECSMFPGNLISISDQNVIFPTLFQNWTAVLKSAACVLETLFLFQTKLCDFPYPTCISDLNFCPQECSMFPGNLISISDQNMWFSLPYTRTELRSSRVQHVSWKPYFYFRSKYVIFPTLYQNWTAVLESAACVLETLFLFQTKICDSPHPISELNIIAVLESSACVVETLFLFQTKICDFPYPTSELNCCPKECSMCAGNLIPISDQNMWFSLPYIRTELLSSRVQHVSWKLYSYYRPKYVIFPTLYQT